MTFLNISNAMQHDVTTLPTISMCSEQHLSSPLTMNISRDFYLREVSFSFTQRFPGFHPREWTREQKRALMLFTCDIFCISN
jgi:hypothetical protein